MRALEELLAECPHCWEGFALETDCSEVGVHEFTEDCPVCCCPIRFRLIVDATQEPVLEARHPDE